MYEQSPVTAIQHTSPAVVSTQHGQVTARYVIVAGNAYLGDKVEPELAKRSMPCGTGGDHRPTAGRGRPHANPQ